MVIAGRLIQGAAGATILACGLSLLSVANKGDAQLRAVSLWGAAAAVGAAAGPLLGGVLVDVTGWQGLFWIDAGVAVLCMLLTAATVSESRDPDRPRSIDYAGTVLIALTLTPLILGVTKSSDWGWISAGHPGLLRGLDRRRVRVHRRRGARRRSAAGPRAAAQPCPGRVDHRDPDRRGHDQRADVPAQPVLPGPGHPGLQPARGRTGHAAGDGRSGAGGPAGAAAGGEVRRSADDRRRVRPHHRRLRHRGFRRLLVEVRRVPAAARRHRRRHGHVQRPRVVGRDGLRAREPGRRGVRCLQHGPVRRRRGGHRPGRHHLRHA